MLKNAYYPSMVEMGRETNAEEIKAFIEFSILMGINVLPDTYDYWSLTTRELSLLSNCILHFPKMFFGDSTSHALR